MKSLSLFAILLAAPAAFAQSADGWNFLSDASVFRFRLASTLDAPSVATTSTLTSRVWPNRQLRRTD